MRILESETEICEDCTALDLETRLAEADEQFSKGWEAYYRDRSYGGILLSEFTIGSLQARLSPCKLCHFFIGAVTESGSAEKYQIRAIPLLLACFLVRRYDRVSLATARDSLSLSQACITVLPSYCIRYARVFKYDIMDPPEDPIVMHRVLYRYSEYNSFSKGIHVNKVGNNLEFDKVKLWIQTCLSSHSKCNILNDDTTASLEHRQAPLGFKLIDTNNNTVVSSNMNVEYVALSYVWGNNSEQLFGHPRVVVDAIATTKGLGYKYLWVDQLCIDQTRPEEISEQVSNMDLIYRRASLTIMAAAGCDARYGLPGISVDRGAQIYVTISKNLTLLSTPQNVHDRIQESSWWSRGWTFQEGILSRRRLFFTEDQVYYECSSGACYESYSVGEGDGTASISILSEASTRTAMFRGYESTARVDGSETTTDDLHELFSFASEYSHRRLTKDDDSLDAFRGILKSRSISVIDTTFGPFRSYFGMPVSGKSEQHFRDSLCLALVYWHHYPGSAYYQVMNQDILFAVPKRVSNIPSWSWLGWRAPVDFGGPDHRDLPRKRGAKLLSILEGPHWPGQLQTSLSVRFKIPQDNFLSLHDDFAAVLEPYIWLEKPREISFPWCRVGSQSWPLVKLHSKQSDIGPLQVSFLASIGPRLRNFVVTLMMSFNCQSMTSGELIDHLVGKTIKCLLILVEDLVLYSILVRHSGRMLDGVTIWERVGMCYMLEGQRNWGSSGIASRVDPLIPLEGHITQSLTDYCLG
jgi:hypothetical protein